MDHLEVEVRVKQSLRDAGCNAVLTEKFAKLHQDGKTEEMAHLLAAHKKALLKKVHTHQKQIDCLDYLLFHLKQEGAIALTYFAKESP